MRIKIGIAQIPNSTSLDKNFQTIIYLLNQFKLYGVDLVLFPECSLSGFSAKMRECTAEVLNPYLNLVKDWVNDSNIAVVLPTALATEKHIYNCGWWIKKNEHRLFYKIGLTETEQKFFSIPQKETQKVFEILGFRFAILICFEIQHDPWIFFQDGEVDAILWPGYWGWTHDDVWGPQKKSGEPNSIFNNIDHWKVPVLQSNFSTNELDNHKGSSPEGLSFIIGGDNKLSYRGAHKKLGGFIVELEKKNGKALIKDCSPLP